MPDLRQLRSPWGALEILAWSLGTWVAPVEEALRLSFESLEVR